MKIGLIVLAVLVVIALMLGSSFVSRRNEMVVKREAIQALAARIKFDPSAVLQLLDMREHKADRKQFDVNDVFTRYLAAVQQVTGAVDTMLEASRPGQV